jgi:hypothetical protein
MWSFYDRLVKVPNMKYHENTSSGSHADTCGKTETDMVKLSDTPCIYGNMPKNGWSCISTSVICLLGLDRDSCTFTFYVIKHLRNWNLDLWKCL